MVLHTAWCPSRRRPPHAAHLQPSESIAAARSCHVHRTHATVCHGSNAYTTGCVYANTGHDSDSDASKGVSGTSQQAGASSSSGADESALLLFGPGPIALSRDAPMPGIPASWTLQQSAPEVSNMEPAGGGDCGWWGGGEG